MGIELVLDFLAKFRFAIPCSRNRVFLWPRLVMGLWYKNDRLFLLGDGQNPDNELQLPFFIVDDEEAKNPVETWLTYVTRCSSG